jgi:hypothetical protein
MGPCFCDGEAEGLLELDGKFDGVPLGAWWVRAGGRVTPTNGISEGFALGFDEGDELSVGVKVGACEGRLEGIADGIGRTEGIIEGAGDGSMVGKDDVGEMVGLPEGVRVGLRVTKPPRVTGPRVTNPILTGGCVVLDECVGSGTKDDNDGRLTRAAGFWEGLCEGVLDTGNGVGVRVCGTNVGFVVTNDGNWVCVGIAVIVGISVGPDISTIPGTRSMAGSGAGKVSVL